jgi:hypothetical protein
MWGQLNKDIKLEKSSTPIASNHVEKMSKMTLKSCPSLTNIQQEEIFSFIETNTLSVKDELNEIILNMSESEDNENNETEQQSDHKIEMVSRENLHNENNINISIDLHNNHTKIDNINNSGISNKMYNGNVNDINKDINNIDNLNSDIGDLTCDELRERWINCVNQTQMMTEDVKMNETYINNEDDDETDEENHGSNSLNDKNELQHWTNVINNQLLSQEEKKKIKNKLKKVKDKNKKKLNKIIGSLL